MFQPSIAHIEISRRRFLLTSSAAVGGAAVVGTGVAAPFAHAAPAGPTLEPWPDATVVFDDDATSMADAGWAPRAAAAGAYAIDSVGSAENPHDLPLPTVEPGQYLLHADEVGQPATNWATMNRPIAIGEGAWQLALRMRVDDVPEVYENAFTRGLVLEVNAAGQRFTFALVDRDQLHVRYSTAVNTHVRTVPVPFDQAFHDWVFRFDGVDTTTVAIDGSVVAVLRNVNVPVRATEGITMSALALNWKSGSLHILLDHITMSVRPSSPLGPGTSLVDSGWTVDPATAGAYLTDNTRSAGAVAGMPPVTAGECLLAATSGRVVGRHPANLGDGSWTLRLLAKGAALPAAGDLGTRGVGWHVDAGGQHLELGLVAGLVGLRKVDGSWLTASVPGTTDEKFHRWTVGRDGHGRHVVELDGRIVLITDESVTTPTSAADGLSIIGDGRGLGDPVMITFAAPVIGGGTTTAFHQPSIDAVSVLPASDATVMEVVVGVDGVDPLDRAGGTLQLHAVLWRTDDPTAPAVAERTIAITSRYLPVSLSPGDHAGDLRLDLQVRRGAEIAATAEQRWLAPTEVTVVEADTTAQPAVGAAVLFDRIDACRTVDGTPAAAAGWEPGSFDIDGAAAAGIFLDSTAAARPVVVPVTLTGWVTVRLGFLSGTEAFDVTVGDSTRRITLPDVPEYDPATGFGPRVIGEVEIFTGDGDGQQLIISPVADKQVRPTHVRIAGLSAAEAELAQQPAEGVDGRRAIYNNDGISDFFAGRYGSVADLESNAVDLFTDSDVGGLTWQNGTTFMLTYDSQWAGRPYASLTPAQQDLMRDGDVVAMHAILDMINNGLVPLEVVTARAAEIGIEAYAGLRMNTFYSMAAYPWYNGNIWDEYADSRHTSYAGTPSATRMTYTSPKFATYIRNVLVELAGFDGVDGLDLDFSRYPDVVGWEPDTMAAYEAAYGIDPRREVTPAGSQRWQQFRADLMTAVLRELRAAVPSTKVIARVPQANTLAYGLDVDSWVAEGLVDVLVPTSISHEQFWSNLDQFVETVAGTDVQLYGGMTHTLAGGDLSKTEQDLAERGYATAIVRTAMSSQMYVERASAFYRAGYDGVYVFNNWRARASLGLIGDKVVTEQWRSFALPATWTRLGVEAEPATADDTTDLLAVLESLRSADDLPVGQFRRFRATLDQVARAVETDRTDLASASLERLVAQAREAADTGDITPRAAAVLGAAAVRVAGRL
ncbi:FIMAH domain-containing protein [Microlunatus sp. Y2014]|uniref:FIMAH domain-containing protein n=1 Tax=Microlunatus sp. Y2014 TaxID=3418488 RepID=UPI003DA6F5A8